MSIFLSWIVVASVQLAATMSPGPAFVVAVRNALTYDRKTGIATALGLGAGVGVHVTLTLCGIAIIIAQSAWLLDVIRYGGAAYLIYIGVKSIIAGRKKNALSLSLEQKIDQSSNKKAVKMISVKKAITTGFLTNLLNPKAVVFFTAVFTQFISPETPYAVLVLFGITSVTIEFLWFTGVALVLTHEKVRAVFLSFMHWIERICGGLMVALGLKLALSKA